MRDADHLMIPSQRLHLGTNGMRDFAAVHVFGQSRRTPAMGLRRRAASRFDREHQARNFAARCDRAQWFERFARIR
jgi:hypothetical protein